MMGWLAFFALALAAHLPAQLSGREPAKKDSAGRRTFNVWVFSDAHVGADWRQGRLSLGAPIIQSEGKNGFDWDIALDLGDLSGEQGCPNDDEGAEIVRQFGLLKKHAREDIYDISGNHDRSCVGEPDAWWWRKWVDPTGEHTEYSRVDAKKRRYPIEGTWERYSFRVGNLLFLMMSDINEPTQKVGRGKLGGNPAGVVSGTTFRWWKKMVEDNPSSIIITTHHYVLKNTTVASGEWEGMTRDSVSGWVRGYHGYFEQGSPNCASYLCWVDGKKDSHAFEDVLAALPGRVDLWLGGHTHTSPDDTFGGKSHVERRWGTEFINVAALTKYMGPAGNLFPRSWLLTFTEGSDEVAVKMNFHGDEYYPQGSYPANIGLHWGLPIGPKAVVKLSKPFEIPAPR